MYVHLYMYMLYCFYCDQDGTKALAFDYISVMIFGIRV